MNMNVSKEYGRMNTSEICDFMNNNVSSKANEISNNGKESVCRGLYKTGSLKYVLLAAYLVGLIPMPFQEVTL